MFQEMMCASSGGGTIDLEYVSQITVPSNTKCEIPTTKKAKAVIIYYSNSSSSIQHVGYSEASDGGKYYEEGSLLSAYTIGFYNNKIVVFDNSVFSPSQTYYITAIVIY